jgi:hypothetical protein
MGGDQKPVFVAGDIQNNHGSAAFDLREIGVRMNFPKINDGLPFGCLAGFLKSDEPFPCLRVSLRRLLEEKLCDNSNGDNMYPVARKCNQFPTYFCPIHPPHRRAASSWKVESPKGGHISASEEESHRAQTDGIRPNKFRNRTTGGRCKTPFKIRSRLAKILFKKILTLQARASPATPLIKSTKIKSFGTAPPNPLGSIYGYEC